MIVLFSADLIYAYSLFGRTIHLIIGWNQFVIVICVSDYKENFFTCFTGKETSSDDVFIVTPFPSFISALQREMDGDIGVNYTTLCSLSIMIPATMTCSQAASLLYALAWFAEKTNKKPKINIIQMNHIYVQCKLTMSACFVLDAHLLLQTSLNPYNCKLNARLVPIIRHEPETYI